MNTEVMEKKLYSACSKGDLPTLEALMREDELTLARVSISSCFNQTPLHLAYERGFASRLDSQGRSPLHLASANGHADVVKLLLDYDEKIRRVPDEYERTPLRHLDVMNGQSADSVSELIKVNTDDQELGAILRLCVMHNRRNVLILLLESNDVDLSDMRDGDGNTILHSAAALKRTQMIKYLVKNRSEAELNALNKKGVTALDIIEEMPEDVKTMEIKELLNKNIIAAPARSNSIFNKPFKIWTKLKSFTIFQNKLEERDETLLGAASLIAAMTYTAVLSPPSGVAGIDAKTYSNGDLGYVGYNLFPGSSLLAYFDRSISNTFWAANTTAFVVSLFVIFLYVTGASTVKVKFMIWLIRFNMCLTISAMVVAYEAAIRAITPKIRQNKRTLVSVRFVLYVWWGCMLFVIVAVANVLLKLIKPKLKMNKWRRGTRNQINASVDASTGTTPTHVIVSPHN